MHIPSLILYNHIQISVNLFYLLVVCPEFKIVLHTYEMLCPLEFNYPGSMYTALSAGYSVLHVWCSWRRPTGTDDHGVIVWVGGWHL